MYYSSNNEMALGIFGGDYFYKLRDAHGWIIYGFGIDEADQGLNPLPEEYHYLRGGNEGIVGEASVLGNVWIALWYFSKVNMVLDRIVAPLNTSRSITCSELQMILDNPDILKKTVFWLKGKQVSTESVLKVIQGQVYFDNIDFSTL